jgi:ADP-heptose:LPS heptosyltransferase
MATSVCRFLVVHPGALGDVLQAVPALGALRGLGEGAHLTLAGQQRLGRLLAGTGVVDAAIPFEGLGLEALFADDSVPSSLASRLAGFDRVISWFGSRAHPFPERLSAIVPGAIVALPVPDTGPLPTVWEHLLGTLAPWGVTGPACRAPLRLPEEWRAEARLVLSRLGATAERSLLVVHPGAGGEDKRWPVEGFARVIVRVALESECQVLIHEGPADGGVVERLFRALDRPLVRLREPPLDLLAAVLQEASAYLGGDSGVSHLAAAVGAPAVILFPAATRERWAPWSPTAVSLAWNDGLNEIETVTRAVSERLARVPAALAEQRRGADEVADKTVTARGAQYAEASHQALLKALKK